MLSFTAKVFADQLLSFRDDNCFLFTCKASELVHRCCRDTNASI